MMMNLINKFVLSRLRMGIFLFLSIISSQAFADCEGMIDMVRKKLDFHGQTLEKWSFVDCKAWPQNPSIVVLLLVGFSNNFGATDDETGFYDLRIFVLNSDLGEISSELYEKNAFPSDAIRLNTVSIDFAPYILGSDQRAFGVRARFSNQSVVNSWEHEQLNLYLMQGTLLKKILGGLVTSKKLYEKINDCNESLTELNRKLIVASTSTFGKADLILKERMVDDKSNLMNERCTWKRKIHNKSYLLRFNGQIYVIPEELHIIRTKSCATAAARIARCLST